MPKRFRGDEAAERLGLPVSVLNEFVTAGMIEPCETVGEDHYFQQAALDRLEQRAVVGHRQAPEQVICEAGLTRGCGEATDEAIEAQAEEQGEQR